MVSLLRRPGERQRGADARLINTVQPYTMSDPLRLSVLYGLARELTADAIAGDIVECGVCNGGSAAIMGAARLPAPGSRLWLYDTYAGIPAAEDRDGALAQTYTGKLVGSVEQVYRALAAVGFPADRAVIRKGLFADTFAQQLPAQVALLHVDADWYSSVLLALETFYPLVVEGGYIVLDDFGFWEGARQAFYQFCRSHEIEPLLERAGETQAFWRKGRVHNRDLREQFTTGVYKPEL